MPGILHLFFGSFLGLIVMKISEQYSGKKKWSISLLFIFIVNNYTGPDFGNVIKQIAETFQSEVLYDFGLIIHSYFGYFLFTIISAPIWWLILKFLEKSRTLKSKHDEQFTDPLHSYAQVHMVVLAGGVFHFFMDLVGHRDAYMGEFFMRGRIPISPIFDIPMILTYLIVLIITYISVFFIYSNSIKRRDYKKVFDGINTALKSKEFYILIVFLIIGTINALLMYYIPASQGLITINIKTYDWIDKQYYVLYFNWADLMEVTWDYPPIIGKSADWYTIIAIIILLTTFLPLHIRRSTIKIKTKKYRSDLMSIFLFMVIVFIGYILQPFIGNISREEFDLGALLGVWFTMLLGLLILSRIDGKDIKSLYSSKVIEKQREKLI